MYKPESIVYIDEAGMDNREDYGYGWNEKGQRFHALKSGRRQGRVNMIAACCNGKLFAPFTVEGARKRTGRGILPGARRAVFRIARTRQGRAETGTTPKTERARLSILTMKTVFSQWMQEVISDCRGAAVDSQLHPIHIARVV